MSAIFKCRVCGKEYEGCRNRSSVPGIYNWQEVACSPECGAIYLAQINASRNAVSESAIKVEPEEGSTPKKRKVKKAKETEE